MPTLRTHNDNANSIYFCTLTVIEWIDIFTKAEYFEVLINSLKYCQQHKGLVVYGYVFMTNHIHLLIQTNSPHSMADFLRDFKKWTTHEIKKLLENESRRYIRNLLSATVFKKRKNTLQIWQAGNYPEGIESEKFFLQKLEYIHMNPVKKQYVQKPEEWLYSSARNWICDDHSLIRVKTTELL